MAISGSRGSQLTALLQTSIVKASLLPGKFIHGEAVHGLSRSLILSDRLVPMRAFSEILRRDAYFLNTILTSRCKSGDVRSARKLLGETPHRNVISWNIVISALVRNGSLGEALDLYRAMRREGFLPTQFTFASVLSACGGLGSLDLGGGCHGLAIKVGLSVDTFVGNALAGMYAKCMNPCAATKTFEGITLPNIVSYTVLMGALEQDGCFTEAMKLLPKMANMGIQVDAVAVCSALVACTKSRDYGEEVGSSVRITRASGSTFGKQLHALVIKLGFGSNVCVGNSLIDMYAKYGHIDDALVIFRALPEADVVSFNVLIATHMRMGEPETARRLFDEMENPSLASWNTVISGYSRHELHDEAIDLFRTMQQLNSRPDRATFAVILSSCSAKRLLHFGEQVHAASTRMTLHLDVFLASGLIDLYCKCGRVDKARRIFDKMLERDVVSWNSMISGLSLSSQNAEAVMFFRLMREEGIVPTEYSYATIISSCARLPSLSCGRQMHAQVAKHGLAGDVFVGSALIGMYAKCGIIEEARLLFDHMPGRNIVSWNEMILGYARNGDGGAAMELFRSLLGTKEKPDGVTFLALLTACSHSGFVDEGIGILNSMEREHGVEPHPDHYACVLDALGRAGRLEETRSLLVALPCEEDPVVWEAFLSACRVHGDAKLGGLAAERLIRVDRRSTAAYVLLSSIYASLGRWDGSSAVRELMNERGVGKGRGCSWTEGRDG